MFLPPLKIIFVTFMKGLYIQPDVYIDVGPHNKAMHIK